MKIDKCRWDALEDYRDSLEHYGVPGMKWGVRKSRVTSGKKRSLSQKAKDRRAQRARNRVARAKARAEKKEAEDKKKAASAATKKEVQRKKILSNPTSLYKHRNEFTAQEIQQAMQQFEWEQRLSNYSKTRINNGAEFVGTLVKYANNSINLYNAAARIANSVGKKDDALPFIKPMPIDKKDDKKK